MLFSGRASMCACNKHTPNGLLNPYQSNACLTWRKEFSTTHSFPSICRWDTLLFFYFFIFDFLSSTNTFGK